MKRWINGSIAIMLTIPLLAGCFGSGGAKPSVKQLVKPLAEDEQASLKMYGWMNERNFIYNVGSSYLVEFPNIELTFTENASGQAEPDTDPFETLFKDIEKQKPDIFMLGARELSLYAERGLLYDLDPLIKQDKFDIENIHAGTVEEIRSKGGGKLFGLAPMFNSSALFYNKDLFDKFQVPYPKDQMTWDELFELAKKFPVSGGNNERVYGFDAGNTTYFVDQLAAIHGIAVVDQHGKKMTVDSDAYRSLWTKTIEAKNAGYISSSLKSESFEFTTPTRRSFVGLFEAGKAAMSIQNNATIQNLSIMKDSNLKPFQWGMVTVPVDPRSPNESPYYTSVRILAINAKSPNVRAAWQLLKYWNSERYSEYYAKTKTRISIPSALLSRTAYNKAPEGVSLEPFYKLMPSKGDPGLGILKAPSGFYNAYDKIRSEETKAIIDGTKSVEDALRSFQERGQKELDRVRAESDAKKSEAE
ncbi:ABC transporter substrate-binding protein [Paenibacillus contaminans]|uniref:Sugar ABC transporter substrate-binding protein n=1 Tax=Paenibacillus contaminans TaxID=450362 RepID=A0A329LMC5_9BACL|nr:extracellular solute-binding protein [Paenibacillus contaminans]RAV08336.1 hypothetical protein DQG23_41220 [Paenibacillus contaminans]